MYTISGTSSVISMINCINTQPPTQFASLYYNHTHVVVKDVLHNTIHAVVKDLKDINMCFQLVISRVYCYYRKRGKMVSFFIAMQHKHVSYLAAWSPVIYV